MKFFQTVFFALAAVCQLEYVNHAYVTTVNLKAAKLDESNKMGKSRINLWTDLKKWIWPISVNEKAFEEITRSLVEEEGKSYLNLHLLFFTASVLIVTPSDIAVVCEFPLSMLYIYIYTYMFISIVIRTWASHVNCFNKQGIE